MLFVVLAFGAAMMQKGNWDGGGSSGSTSRSSAGPLRRPSASASWGPELGRIDKTAEQFGPDLSEVRDRVQRLFLVFRFDTALLILIVVDMVAKPSF